MALFAHSEGGYSWGGPVEPWEIHPALNHLPIAFLLGGVVLDLYAWARGRPSLVQVATGMLIAGVVTGVLAALAGLLAFYTVPGHTEVAHRLMYWHLGIQATSLVLFIGPTWKRSRNRAAPPSMVGRLVLCLAAVLLLVGSGIGGYIVYHGGAGIDPKLLSPEVRGSHSHNSAIRGIAPSRRSPLTLGILFNEKLQQSIARTTTYVSKRSARNTEPHRNDDCFVANSVCNYGIAFRLQESP
jgi:uncharacterized membrane protein